MTEVPEYLLARTRERRAAMGGGGDAGGDATSVAATTDSAAAAPAPVAMAEFVPAEPPPPAPVPFFVEAALRRKKMPVWVVPVMLVLPIWGVYYVGTLEAPPASATGLLGEGEEVFASSCSGCHGSGGGGGVGRQLDDGEVLLTFPDTDLAGHISWIVNGSPALNGTPYGNPARPGGQRTSEGGMAGWAGTLDSDELLGVVYYERLTHGGLDPESAAAELELLEAYVDSGVEFEGDESPREIAGAISELGFEPGEAGNEEAAG